MEQQRTANKSCSQHFNQVEAQLLSYWSPHSPPLTIFQSEGEPAFATSLALGGGEGQSGGSYLCGGDPGVQKLLSISNPAQFTDEMVSCLLTDASVSFCTSPHPILRVHLCHRGELPATLGIKQAVPFITGHASHSAEHSVGSFGRGEAGRWCHGGLHLLVNAELKQCITQSVCCKLLFAAFEKIRHLQL